MRVLATFPDLAEPVAARADAGPAESSPPAVVPATLRPRSPRPIRRTHRSGFPVASILLLALITAAVWGLVNAREAMTTGRRQPADLRLAAEPAAPERTR